jgi:hypothetical protein
MLLESVFVILLILVFTVIFYRAAIHEYTIIQKDWATIDTNWSELIAERSPLIIRECPKEWIKLWNRSRTANFGWPVVLKEGNKKVRASWSTYLKTGVSANKSILNGDVLADTAGLADYASVISNEIRRPFWLPGSLSVSGLSANIIQPINSAYVGLKKTTAESTCWICTDGAPMRIWLAHEGATKGGEWLPNNPYGRDPWNFKPEETPWISELKYIEIRLRAGNVLILPPHWWVALRCDINDGKLIGDGSWYWTTEFHSPISYLASCFQNK